MRVVAQLADPRFLISIFAWNQKFIVKCELGGLEQSFKVSMSEVPDVATLQARLTEEWRVQVHSRFESMEKLREHLER